MIFFQTE